MYKIFKIIVVASVFFSVASAPSFVHAQNYKGALPSKNSNKNKKTVDKAARPIPKVFSSKLTSVQQAEKLDVLYDNLYVALWLHASTDFIYQKKLYGLIRAEKFQYTRYAKEFSGDLEAAMENLNGNFNDLMADIEAAENGYKEIKEGIRMADHEVLEPLWEEKIEAFRTNAEDYFKMQHNFLNVYRKLVGFIMKQGGSYYYKKDGDGVYFYKFGGYKYYGQSIDKLKKISFEQRQLLRDNKPANTDIKLK